MQHSYNLASLVCSCSCFTKHECLGVGIHAILLHCCVFAASHTKQRLPWLHPSFYIVYFVVHLQCRSSSPYLQFETQNRRCPGCSIQEILLHSRVFAEKKNSNGLITVFVSCCVFAASHNKKEGALAAICIIYIYIFFFFFGICSFFRKKTEGALHAPGAVFMNSCFAVV